MDQEQSQEPSQEELAKKFLELQAQIEAENSLENLLQASIERLEEVLSNAELLKLLAVSLTQSEIDQACDDDLIIDELVLSIKNRMSSSNTVPKSFYEYGIKVVNDELVEADLTLSKKALTLAALTLSKSKHKEIAQVIQSTGHAVAWYKTEYKAWIKQAQLLVANGQSVSFASAKRG